MKSDTVYKNNRDGSAVSEGTSSGSSDTSQSSIDSKLLPLPPDGGYGWVIVGASFMVFALLDGFSGAFGILLPYFLEHFNAGRAKTVLAGSVFGGVFQVAGPLVSALINIMGCRPVAILGGILATGSCVISIFSPNIDVFIFTFGALVGIGAGMIYIPACVMPGYYFERKRAVAAGISTSGSGIGMVLVPPLVALALEEYAWQGVVVILAGIAMQFIVFGALMRPLDTLPRNRLDIDVTYSSDSETDTRELLKRFEILGEKTPASKFHSHFPTLYEEERTVSLIKPETVHGHRASFNTGYRLANYMLVQEYSGNEFTDKTTLSTSKGEENANSATKPTFIQSCHELPLSERAKKKQDNRDNEAQIPAMETKQNNSPTTVSCYELGKLPDLAHRGHSNKKIDREKMTQELLKPFARQDVFYTGSIQSLREYKAQPNMASYVASVMTIPVNTESASCACVSEHTLATLRDMLDISIMIEPCFVLIAVSESIIMLSFLVPIIFMADHASSLGMSTAQSALLMSVYGIFNTAGRAVSGVLTNAAMLNVFHIYCLSLVGAGVCCCLMVTVCNSLLALFAVISIYGMLCTAFVPLTTVLLVKYLGLARLTNAYGYLAMMKGVVSIIGPPIAGALLDVTASFKVPYILAGSMYVVAGLLVYLLPLAHKRRINSCSDT